MSIRERVKELMGDDWELASECARRNKITTNRVLNLAHMGRMRYKRIGPRIVVEKGLTITIERIVGKQVKAYRVERL